MDGSNDVYLFELKRSLRVVQQDYGGGAQICIGDPLEDRLVCNGIMFLLLFPGQEFVDRLPKIGKSEFQPVEGWSIVFKSLITKSVEISDRFDTAVEVLLRLLVEGLRGFVDAVIEVLGSKLAVGYQERPLLLLQIGPGLLFIADGA